MAKKGTPSSRWKWEVNVKVKRGEKLMLDYCSHIDITKKYSEVQYDAWIVQVRKDALKTAKKEFPGIDLRSCKIEVDAELALSGAPK